MKIAVVSYNPAWLKPVENVDQCIQIIACAQQQNCQLVIFPEMTLTGFSPQYACLEPSVFQYCLEKFKESALKYNVYVIFGALSRHSSSLDQLPTNDAFVISPKQEIICRYSKLHLFSPADEHFFVKSGSKILTFSIDDMQFAPSICYDLRFSEIYSALASKVDCYINIASWPSKRIDHWYALLKARAIENQAYVIGVNRSGEDGNGLMYDPSSIIYDPLGNSVCLVQSSHFDCLSFGDIDLSFVGEIRSGFDILSNKRHDLYKLFFSAS